MLERMLNNLARYYREAGQEDVLGRVDGMVEALRETESDGVPMLIH